MEKQGNIKSKSSSLGRRSGKPETSQTILGAARRHFSMYGYQHTTIRSIATEAAVDPALVMHFFSSKYELFLAAMLPVYQGPGMLQEALEGDRQTFGQRIARLFCYLMQDKSSHETLLGMVRVSASETQAAKVMQEFIERNLLEPMAGYLGGSDAHMRASLIGSQLVGLFVARYIVKLEPLASASLDEIAVILGPILQQYV